MTTKNLFTKAAALALAGSLATGCIQEDCLDTYFLDDATKTVSIKPEFTERVNDISLTIEARNMPYNYRGEYAYAENLRLKCAPNVDNNCLEGYEYEFFVNYITPDGERIGVYSENNGGYNALLDLREFRADGITEGGVIECNVWSPKCTTKGYFYRDEYGITRIHTDEWRPRTLVGSATAVIAQSAVCPAPLPPFKPVSDEELQNATSQ
ncbi:MAG: hypothetical protein V1734_04175 [Nanoarchaeota archaeon]